MTQRKIIPNPNRMSDTEQDFVTRREFDRLDQVEVVDRYKGRMISMSDSFYKQLNSFLRNNPTEGNRSSFIVRIVAEYINKKGQF